MNLDNVLTALAIFGVVVGFAAGQVSLLDQVVTEDADGRRSLTRSGRFAVGIAVAGLITSLSSECIRLWKERQDAIVAQTKSDKDTEWKAKMDQLTGAISTTTGQQLKENETSFQAVYGRLTKAQNGIFDDKLSVLDTRMRLSRPLIDPTFGFHFRIDCVDDIYSEICNIFPKSEKSITHQVQDDSGLPEILPYNPYEDNKKIFSKSKDINGAVYDDPFQIDLEESISFRLCVFSSYEKSLKFIKNIENPCQISVLVVSNNTKSGNHTLNIARATSTNRDVDMNIEKYTPSELTNFGDGGYLSDFSILSMMDLSGGAIVLAPVGGLDMSMIDIYSISIESSTGQIMRINGNWCKATPLNFRAPGKKTVDGIICRIPTMAG